MIKKIILSCGILCSLVLGIELKVGASPVPHAEILENIKKDLKQKGIDLIVVNFTDYVTPNLALNDKSIDANYFQHLPYLNKMIEERKLNLISLGAIHVEPLGVYSRHLKDLNSLKENAKIAVPNDPTNFARALILLHQKGVIKLKDPTNLLSTEFDIIKNSKNIKIVPIEAPLLPRVLGDVDAAIINGNYALQSGLTSKDTLALEGKESPYANVLVTYKGISAKKRKALDELLKALQSEKTREFMERKYKNEVLPAF